MSIYDIRKAGREYCQTEGSEHYKTEDKVEPIDLIIALGYGEGFCMGSIIKYAARFKRTQNLDDLKKASDYSQILAGIKLEAKKQEIKTHTREKPICDKGFCDNINIDNADKLRECQETRKESDTPGSFSKCPWRILLAGVQQPNDLE